MLVLGFPEYLPQAQELARALNTSCGHVEVHTFPDGESRLTLPSTLPERVVLCRGLDQPNAKLIELMLTTGAARDLGANHVTLVAPYLCYMRQDTAFQPGEAVSQRIVGHFLANLVDAIVTVDPHLHRTSTLAEAVPAKRTVALSAGHTMGEFLASRGVNALLVGPDRESEQWVSTVAASAGLDYVVAHKTRRGDRTVEIRLPQRVYRGVNVVLIDDVASTGNTLATAARALRGAGAAQVDVLVTHALLTADALAMLKRAGVQNVWSSDSVSHSTNALSLSRLLAQAIE